ncbi:hypothetical protein [Pseudonocardia spinosispora]|uniref:hypothetical protein n=1 Tax=Pseudonocardia spinosispora TaxID=103441 RepID=UPI0012EC161C|nr:hypothetical protein [Pseudonocardia spinosispora]
MTILADDRCVGTSGPCLRPADETVPLDRSASGAPRRESRRMHVRFVVTDHDGTPVASGVSPTDADELGSLANVGHITRLLRAGNVVLHSGQRLTAWIDDTSPAA